MDIPELEYYKVEDLKCKKDLNALYNKFESLNGQRLENKKVEEFNKTYGTDNLKDISAWVTIFEIGLLTAFIAHSMDAVVTHFAKWQYIMMEQLLLFYEYNPSQKDCLIGVSVLHSFFLTIATLFVLTIAPLATGSGLDFLRIYLNGIDIPELLSYKTMIIKMYAVIIVSLSGLASSYRETVLYFGAFVAKKISTARYINLNLKNYFDCERDTRDFILAGIATGAAASFHTMFCGILLSIELCASIINHANVLRVLGATCMGYVIFHIYGEIFNVFDTLKDSTLPNFKDIQEKTYFFEVLLYVPLAVIVGVFGGIWTCICNAYYKVRKIVIHRNKFLTVLELLIIYASTRVTHYLLYEQMDNCGDKVSRMFCKSDQTKSSSLFDWITIPFYTRWTIIITDPLGAFKIKFQIFYLIHLFICSVFIQHLKLPITRIFVLLTMGALFGRIYAEFLFKWFKWDFLNSTLYAIMGSSAMIGSGLFFNMSFTVLIFENFNCHAKFTAPIAASNLIGAGVANILFRDFYYISVRDIPFLSYKPPSRIAKLKAKHIMASPVICFKSKEKPQYIFEALTGCCHNGFPVVDYVKNDNRSNGRYRGMITRDQLIELFLKQKAIEMDRKQIVLPIGQRYWRKLDNFRNSAEKRNYVDLFYEMNHFTFRITPDYPMVKIFSIFLALALRHMPVVDHTNRVIGIITRKDFLIEKPYDFSNDDDDETDFWTN